MLPYIAYMDPMGTVFKPDRYKYVGTEYSNDLTVLTGIMVRTGVCLSQNRQSFQVSESF